MLLLLGFFSIPLLIVATPMILLVIFGLALPKVKRLNHQWERLALSLGMRFVPGSLSRAPSMNGLIDGIPVRVTVIQSKGRRNHTRRTQVAARPDVDFPEAFRLAGESLLSTIDQALGVRDIKTGHQPFDQRMMITGKDPGTVLVGLSGQQNGTPLDELQLSKGSARAFQAGLALRQFTRDRLKPSSRLAQAERVWRRSLPVRL